MLSRAEREIIKAKVETVAYNAGADLSITAADMRRVYLAVERILKARCEPAA